MEFPCDLTLEVDGKTQLVLKSADIEWEMSHTSFAVEFDLNCGVGASDGLKTLLSSILFVGSAIGLFLGGVLFDYTGRKNASLFALFLVLVSTFLGTFCHNYYFLLFIRLVQGIGVYMSISGFYIIFLEISPHRYRNHANLWAQALYALGYQIAAGVGYFVKDWNFMFLATSVILILFNLQQLFSIESPRYYLIKGDKESAKECIASLAAWTKTSFDLNTIELEDLKKAEERKHGFWRQLIDLRSYPSLLFETFIQVYLWFVITMCYYGMNFGWSSIIPNIYLGYVLSGAGHLIGSLTVFPLISRLGRRRTMMFTLAGLAAFLLLAIPDVKLGKDTGWTLESVSSLIGVIFAAGSSAGIWLWTTELAPTSHRGFVFCMGSGAARIGSFLGPYIFLNLKPATHKAVPYGGLVFLLLLCFLGTIALVETGDKEKALTGEDVAARRKSHKYRI